MPSQIEVAHTLDRLSVRIDQLRSQGAISPDDLPQFLSLVEQAVDGLQSDHSRIHGELCELRRGLINILERLKHT